MKEVLNVCGIKSSKDVNKVRQAISSNDGVLACKIEKSTGAVEIVCDNYANMDDIIESIEDTGFTVI